MKLNVIKTIKLTSRMRVELCQYVDDNTTYDKKGKLVDGYSNIVRVVLYADSSESTLEDWDYDDKMWKQLMKMKGV